MNTFLLLFFVIASAFAAPSPLITGGVDASKGEFPYQVSVQFSLLGIRIHMCGGSIIAKNWVVTAGHCVNALPILNLGKMEVLAGVTNLRRKRQGQMIKVVKRIHHPSYPGGIKPNDIALLKLESDLEFNEYVQPIALPEAGAVPSGNGTVTGWGSTSTSIILTRPQKLKKVSIPIVDHQTCYDALDKASNKADLLDETSNVCTLNDGILGACFGDSGTPLAVNGKIVGIYSWSLIPCGGRNEPSVFTKVSSFIDWINNIIQSE